MCSLMSSISNAHSLKTITLDSVKCEDHVNGEGCRYDINLAGHTWLKKLNALYISPGSVTLSSSITDITMRNIHTLSHDCMCSLMSSISNARSLQTITLDSVKCKDHASGEGCEYVMDLSKHSERMKIDVRDISPGSLTLGPMTDKIKMGNIHTLSHDGMCSLMSSISNARSLSAITLDSVKCKDHASGEGCEYVMDLSGHSRLFEIDVSNISPGSLTLSPMTIILTMRNIHTLSHDSMCSLMSKLSPLQRRGFKSIRCIDYASGNPCGKLIEWDTFWW